MTITHEEARRLIQFKADDALQEPDSHLLETHLRSCPACQNYQASIAEMESTIRPLLQRKWNQHPLPHPAGKAISGRYQKLIQRTLFATRIAAMGLICIAFLFNVWQFTQSGGQGTKAPSAGIPLIPTPSLQSTQTRMTDQKCEMIPYLVQGQDTLETIADRFSVSVEEIRNSNPMSLDTLNTSTRLLIPVCNPTPAGTPNTIRSTYTPLLGSNTLTPVNSPTQ